MGKQLPPLHFPEQCVEPFWWSGQPHTWHIWDGEEGEERSGDSDFEEEVVAERPLEEVLFIKTEK